VLEALSESDNVDEVAGVRLGRVLDDLLNSNQQVTRALLGVEPSAMGRAAGGPGGVPFAGPDGAQA